MIIGITGKKRAGKDTAAGVIEERFGFYRYGLADPIREICQILFGWDTHRMDHDKETIDPEYGISYRQAAQMIGTDLFRVRLPELLPEFARVTGDAIWLRRLEKIHNLFDLVVPDIRFPNEAKRCDILIRIVRPGFVHTDPHPSENEMDAVTADATIYNNGTLQQFKDKVSSVMEELV